MASEIFTQIYRERIWDGPVVIDSLEGGSGDGSDPNKARIYMDFLQNFLRDSKYNVKSVIDLGCGDWQFSQYIDWEGIDYTGVDCVQPVIEHHQNKHQKENIHFLFLDFLNNPEKIPSGDVCILKDVLQHWPNSCITTFLSYLIENKLFKYILITNCSYQWAVERPMNLGGFIALSPTMEPLSKFNPIPLLHYSTKTVSLITV